MVPQCYGYNGVELDVPAAGSEITLSLTGIMPEDSKGEWNYALLPVKSDSVADYSAALRAQTIDGKGKEIHYTVPEDGLSHLWLVVNAVPEVHNPDKVQTAWNYSVALEGTTPKMKSE